MPCFAVFDGFLSTAARSRNWFLRKKAAGERALGDKHVVGEQRPRASWPWGGVAWGPTGSPAPAGAAAQVWGTNPYAA